MDQVLACIDGSASAQTVCDYAGWAAERLQAPLLLLHVLDEKRYPRVSDLSGSIGLGSMESLQAELTDIDQRRNQIALEQGQAMLEGARQRLADSYSGTPVLRQRHGDLVESLRDLQADTRLLIIGKLGEAHQQAGDSLGDNVERVVRGLQRPILITAGEFVAPRAAMLAFDGSPVMQSAVALLAESPLFRGLDVHLVTVGADSPELRQAAQLLEQAGHRVQVAQLSGEVETALHRYQREQGIDLVVMGAYGHSRIREFFVGSTTNALLRMATVPHLIFRQAL